MAAPIAAVLSKPFVNKLGRTIYRQGGKFISQGDYFKALRAPMGSFIQRGSKTTLQSIAQQMMAEIGPPIGGGNWVSRVRQSSDKFEEFLGDSLDTMDEFNDTLGAF